MSDSHLIHDVLASCLEIVGTFLLAVEAIKLENLRKFRVVFFGKPISLLTPRIIVPQNTSNQEITAIREEKEMKVFLLLGAVGFGFLVLMGSMGQISVLSIWHSARIQLPASVWATAVLGFILVTALLGLSLLIGFLLYKTLLLLFNIPFTLLELIEAKTASGGIGITGFVLFLVGALIHIMLKFVA